jgi:hypothetical protein
MRSTCDDARLSSLGPDTMGTLWFWGPGPPPRWGSLGRLISIALAARVEGNMSKVEIELPGYYLDLQQIQRLAADPRFSSLLRSGGSIAAVPSPRRD